MRSFPWDSIAVSIGEDGFPVYDRAYDSQDLADVNMAHFGDGVVQSDKGEFAVTASGDSMSVTVGFGMAEIRGRTGFNDNDTILDVPPSEALKRIDTVVVRMDKNPEARSVDLYIVKGTASENPIRPTLTRDENVWEFGIADITVLPNAISIGQSNIVSTVSDITRCGYSGLRTDASNISGTLMPSQGGTGVTTQAAIGLLAYPVGALYFSTKDVSPASLFGGTWERFGNGRVIRSATNTDTGGADTVKLTIAQMPIHAHNTGSRRSSTEKRGFGLIESDAFVDRVLVAQTGDVQASDWTTFDTGGGGSHNNLPAYQNCFVWKRVA